MSGVERRARTAVALTCLVSLLAVMPALGQPEAVAGARVFYVAPAGNDNNSGFTRDQPFQQIQRCAAVMIAGDTCVIMSGTYRETVRPPRSGTASAPITYLADSDKVYVDGSDVVTGWARLNALDLVTLSARDPYLAASPFAQAVRSGAVYRTRVALNTSLPAGQLFLDDKMMVEAQFPDPGLDLLAPKIQFARSGTNLWAIADPALGQRSGYWKGARVYVQRMWMAHTGVVTASSPGAVSIADHYGIFDDGRWDVCTEVAPNDTRYYLWGKLSELSGPGEWFYDTASKYLYLRTPAGDHPAGHRVAVKQRSLAFDLDGVSHTQIRGPNVFGATISSGDTSEGLVLDGLHVQYPSHFMELKPDPKLSDRLGCDTLSAGGTTSGVILRGRNNEIRNSTVRFSAGNGVALIGENSRATNNVITDVDYLGSTGASGINIVGNNHTVMNNTVSNSGRTGIMIHSLVAGRKVSGVRIAYNDVSYYGRLSVDLGAIWACCYIDLNGTVIDHNWVHHSALMPNVPPWWATGIYLDGGEHNGLVHSNVGWSNRNTTVSVRGAGDGSGSNMRIYNNSGGLVVWHLLQPGRTEVTNNIGYLAVVESGPGIVVSNHLPDSVDPQYVDPAALDYRLRDDSPARNAGAYLPGVTEGFTDPNPSIGAYQYGAPFWRAGTA